MWWPGVGIGERILPASDFQTHGISCRDALTSAAQYVLARRYFAPGCHRLEPYVGDATRLPATEALCGRVLALPTGTSITKDDIATICAIIRLAIARGDELRQLLQTRVSSHTSL